MTNKNILKRTVAGLTALALVAGALPANVGGFLTEGAVIKASAYELGDLSGLVDRTNSFLGSDFQDSNVYNYLDQNNSDLLNSLNNAYGSASTYRMAIEDSPELENEQDTNNLYTSLKSYLEKALYACTIISTPDTITWDGEDHNLITSIIKPACEGYQLYIRIKGTGAYDSEWRLANQATYVRAIDTDTYSIYAYYGSAPTIEEVGTLVKTVSITEPAELAVSTPPTLTEDQLTYDGTAKTLASGGAGIMDGDVIEFAVTLPDVTEVDDLNALIAGGYVSFGTAATATNAGTYKVWYRARRGENALDAVPLGTVTIAPAASDVINVTRADSLRYDGTPHYLVLNAPDEGIMYRSRKATDENFSSWSADKPTGTDAGDYIVQWYLPAGNYEARGSETEPAGEFPVDIAKADITNEDFTAPVLANGKALSYNGSAQALLTTDEEKGSIDPAKGTIQYTTQAPIRVLSGSISIDDINVGDILGDVSLEGVETLNLNNEVIPNPREIESSNFSWTITYGDTEETAGFSKANYNALRVTAKEGSTITVARFRNEGEDSRGWSSDIPTATELGTYDIYWRIKGGDNYNNFTPAENGFMGTVSMNAGDLSTNDYTAPTASMTLTYTGSVQQLVTAGAVDTGKGTMKYARIITNDMDKIIYGNTTLISSIPVKHVVTADELTVGAVIYPKAAWRRTESVQLPLFYDLKIGDVTYNSYKGENTAMQESVGRIGINIDEEGLMIYHYEEGSWQSYLYGYNGCDALVITNVDNINKIVTVKPVKYSEIANEEGVFSTTVPTAKNVGTYNVAWRIFGNDKYNDAEGGILTVDLVFKQSALALIGLDDTALDVPVVVTKADTAKTVVDRNATTQKYALTGGKYYIYTNKSIASRDSYNDIIIGIATRDNDKILNGVTYNYRYTIELPIVPEDNYTLTHVNNFEGQVPLTNMDTLYVGEDGRDGIAVAVLKANSKYYYGDTPSTEDVIFTTKGKAYKDGIVNVEEVYFTDTNNNRVANDSLQIGNEYEMTAKVTVDEDGDRNTDDRGVLFLKKKVTFTARPLNECDIYLITEGDTLTANPAFNANEIESDTNKKYTNGMKIGTAGDTYSFNQTGSGDNIIKNYWTTIPEDTFVYTGEDQSPKVAFVNPGNNTVIGTADIAADELNADDAANKNTAKDYLEGGYYFSYSAVPAASADVQAKYAGNMTIKWSIAKATVAADDITVTPNTIVYDGEVVKTADDFTIAAANPAAEGQPQTMAEKLLADTATVKLEPTAVTTDIAEYETIDTIWYNEAHYLNNGDIGIGGNFRVKMPGMENSVADFPMLADGVFCSIAENGYLTYRISAEETKTVSLPEGKCWYYEGRTVGEGPDSYYEVEVYAKNPPVKTYDLKSAGSQKADFTITNPNYNDVVIKNVAFDIAKKSVTVMPKANQSVTYGDKIVGFDNSTLDDSFDVPEYTVTGVVEADNGIDFGDILDVDFGDSTTNIVPAASDTLKAGKFLKFNTVYSLEDLIGQDGITADTVVVLPHSYRISDLSYEEKTIGQWATAIHWGEGQPEDLGKFYISETGDLRYNDPDYSHADWFNSDAGMGWYVEKRGDGKIYICKKPMDQQYVSAGTYDIELQENAFADNYTFTLAKGSPKFTVNQKSITSDDITWNIPDVDYTYDTETKLATVEYTLTDETIGTQLVENTDFETGGTKGAVTPGTYELEFYGMGNYTDEKSSEWMVKEDASYTRIVTMKADGYQGIGAKEYDGSPVEPKIEFKHNNELAAADDLPADINTTITYYKDNGERTNVTVPGVEPGETFELELIDEAAIARMPVLTGAPADAGEYVAVVHTTATGCKFDDMIVPFAIDKKTIKVTPTVTSKQYGEADPTITYSYAPADRILMQRDGVTDTGSFKIDGYTEEVETIDPTTGDPGIDLVEHEYDGSINANWTIVPDGLALVEPDGKANYDLVINYKNFTVKQRIIKSENITATSVCLTDSDGWAHPGNCIKVTVPVYDYTTQQMVDTELVEGTDYEVVSNNRTKKIGDFKVQIRGLGKYAGVAETKVTVVKQEETASAELTRLCVKDAAAKKIAFVVNGTCEAEGITVEKTGVLVYKFTETKTAADVNPKNMILENKETLGLVVGGKAGARYSPNVSNGDYGFVLRPYTILSDGTTVYGDMITTSYEEVARNEAVSVELTRLCVKDAAAKKIAFVVNSSSTSDDYEIVKTGVIVYKLSDTKQASDMNTENMIVENKAALGLVIGGKAGERYSPNVSNGDYGFVLRPYAELADGSYVYGDMITTSFADVASAES